MDRLQVAVRLNSISKNFSGHSALRDITCNIYKGRIHGLLGPNGAGKSTLMNILAGILPPSKGDLLWEVDGQIGFLPEFAPLYGEMSVGDYINFVASLKKIKSSQEIVRVVNLCQLTDVQGRLIGNLSRGYRQRVNLAQALLLRPQFLILDEPFIGLDPQSIHDVRNLILSLKGETTILFSSHQLHEVESICDDLTVMDKGIILKTGSLSEIINSVQKKTVVEISLTQSDTNWKELLENKFTSTEVWLEKKENIVLITISYSPSHEFRPELIKFLVATGGEVLEVKKQELSLESAFEQMVKRAR